jgi:hypothetical protein
MADQVPQGTHRVHTPLGTVLALLVLAGLAHTQAPAQSPQRVFLKDAPAIDEVLKRPYSTEVPFGSTGARVWASSPQGWAFGDDVHWLYLSNMRALDLIIRDAHGPLRPASATSFPSHVHLEGAERAITATASYTSRHDSVDNPTRRPFEPTKRWTAWSSGRREDWFGLDFGAPRSLRGVKLWFYDDTDTGACRPPAEYRVDSWSEGQWKPLQVIRRQPPRPFAGENLAEFEPVETERLRVVFSHAGEEFYTGLYGIEPMGPEGQDPHGPAVELEITGDKFIHADDILVAVLRVKNSSSAPQRLDVIPAPDWQGKFEGRLLSGRASTSPSAGNAGSGPWTFLAESATRLHGVDIRQSLRFAVSSDPPKPQDVAERRAFTVVQARGRDDNATFLKESFGFDYELGPGEALVFKAALEVKPTGESSTLDRVLNPAMSFPPLLEAGSSRLGIVSVERQDTRDLLPAQVKSYQQWFDDNLAAFECSDPLVEKLYLHRAYTLRKNILAPALGALKWPTQAEGRWRSRWYPNVISYGAAHQIREARWLADPSYWSGHLRTWAHNQKPDHVYPGHVTPAGPADGQYTDWITSTTWDGYSVHPDNALLAEVADLLAENVRGWQKVYDPDGDGLLLVDSHWWTGMEYQPSFFAFSDFRTSADFLQPETQVSLERVDLTAYNFGNARTVSRIYQALGQPEKAKEFDELAEKIRAALAAEMWIKDKAFFYSLRAEDDTPADVKEIIGVYPFYFGMLEPGAGYEAAWNSILDPNQFWTPWPVASVSKECPAYSQSGWPQANGRAAGCMWNGPTWPHANSIVLSAMARTLRADRDLPKEKASPLSREKLWELFTSFTKAQFRNQDPTYPWTGEFYNGETGEWKTAERDYNHSTWLDILIPDLIGLVPRADDVLEVDPLVPEGALAHFTLDGQRYHGRDITIVWDAPGDDDDRHSDGRQGLDVYLDGQLAASANSLTRLLIDLKSGTAMEPDARPEK